MRKSHELPAGVICEKCLAKVSKGHYKRVKVEAPVITSTTGENEIIDRMNLCNKCYKKYTALVRSFLNNQNI